MLRCENLTFSYDKAPVIHRLTHTFEAGRITAIVGESGIGKTTLFSLLCGLLRPDEGKILRESKKIAVAFQEPRLFPWMSALQNVRAVSPKEGERAKELLVALGLGDALDLLPDELSGGMKQRVSLARALHYDADIILLDEPFTGLDAETKQRVADYLFSYLEGKTVIMITHGEEELSYAHTVLRLTKAPDSRLELVKSSTREGE